MRRTSDAAPVATPAEWDLSAQPTGDDLGQCSARRRARSVHDPVTEGGALPDSATTSAPRCSTTSESSATETRCSSRSSTIRALRERLREGRRRRGQGELFNSDMTQAIALGYCLDLAACMLQAGRGAEGEPRLHCARRTSAARRRTASCATHHPLDVWKKNRRSCPMRTCGFTKYLAAGGGTY